MSLHAFLIAAAAANAAFGLGLLMAPSAFPAMFGVELDAAGQLTARLLGSSLVGWAFAFWWCRDTASTPNVRAVLLASFLYNLINLPVVSGAIMTGLIGPAGWAIVVLHVLLAVGFGYFSFRKR